MNEKPGLRPHPASVTSNVGAFSRYHYVSAPFRLTETVKSIIIEPHAALAVC
ncbi:MAG: hypothetical protein OXJ55_10790 [Caldilineaceae bacterium]|nr:hypothetical protein [Caldilineaceae bacterium]MDE0463098.1 hypothetical protein [Caldilineaceae bacterium]